MSNQPISLAVLRNTRATVRAWRSVRAPRQMPSTGRPRATTSAMKRFSAASQGKSASSFTLIGPPITTSRSIASGSGSVVDSHSRVSLISAPCPASHWPM